MAGVQTLVCAIRDTRALLLTYFLAGFWSQYFEGHKIGFQIKLYCPPLQFALLPPRKIPEVSHL
ncbi:MAG: hypothetical protein DRR08_06410 [Candidatus Parabeggiatoa sp. nov. 2]|nr:MAG: hypothetical protein B6247_09315 [Beggiatoa sp. 4572_84]RKZ62316.1 MAG: hypothetical protein DRR08_06410 [Gammaproteobacteria bacterium]